jgi:hypothetical protein
VWPNLVRGFQYSLVCQSHCWTTLLSPATKIKAGKKYWLTTVLGSWVLVEVVKRFVVNETIFYILHIVQQLKLSEYKIVQNTKWDF